MVEIPPKALAAADRQLAHVQTSLDRLVGEARDALAEYGDGTTAWAAIGTKVAKQLDCTSRYQQFAVEMLAAAVIRLAQEEGS